MRHRIRVQDIGPGIFSNEVSVSFEVGGKGYTMIVPKEYVEDGTIPVEVVGWRGSEALIDLPRETFTSGSRIILPRESLLPA